MSWNDFYNEAIKYYEEYGNLLIPQNYKVNNINLGKWISRQRSCYKLNSLSNDRKKLLENINMIWDYNEYTWMNHYEVAKNHYHKKLAHDSRYNDWINVQRRKYLQGLLTEKQNVLLEEINYGYVENFNFDTMYSLAKDYYKKHNSLHIPKTYMVNNLNLGFWINSQRILYNRGLLQKEKISKLEDIKMTWKIKENGWMYKFNLLKDYLQEHNTSYIATKVRVNGIFLGTWAIKQRQYYLKGMLKDNKAALLESINFDLSGIVESWMNHYNAAQDYYKEHKNLLIPGDYKIGNINLGRWIIHQRHMYKNGKLSRKKIELLEQISMVWSLQNRKRWEYGYNLATLYNNQHGNVMVPNNYTVNDFNLGYWLHNQRSAYTRGQLSKKRIQKLNDIGMIWDVNNYLWEYQFNLLKEYFKENNTTKVPYGYNYNGINLSTWVSVQKNQYRNGQLSSERVNRLLNIGLNLSVRDAWQEMYKVAKAYYEKFNNLLVNRDYVESGYSLGTWLNAQRVKYNKGELTDRQIKLLENIGMIWDLRKYNFLNDKITVYGLKTRRQKLNNLLYEMLDQKDNIKFTSQDEVKKVEEEFVLKLYK